MSGGHEAGLARADGLGGGHAEPVPSAGAEGRSMVDGAKIQGQISAVTGLASSMLGLEGRAVDTSGGELRPEAEEQARMRPLDGGDVLSSLPARARTPQRLTPEQNEKQNELVTKLRAELARAESRVEHMISAAHREQQAELIRWRARRHSGVIPGRRERQRAIYMKCSSHAPR